MFMDFAQDTSMSSTFSFKSNVITNNDERHRYENENNVLCKIIEILFF